MVGLEVGVDAGAHAHALLLYTDTAHLYLADIWPQDYHYGYCEGRLTGAGFFPRFTMIRRASEGARCFLDGTTLDYMYFDEERTEAATFANFVRWWPLLKPGGRACVRGYAPGQGVKDGADRFLRENTAVIVSEIIHGEEIILVKT